MAKYFLLSFDDGSVWDQGLVALLERFGMRATFNLNSGLEDFVWDLDGFPVRRQRLADCATLYSRHEVASHSLEHPPLEQLSPRQLLWQVGRDCENLKASFHKDSIGFAVPFTLCPEAHNQLLRPLVRYIRLSEFSSSFALPKDCYHIPVHALYNQPDVYSRMEAFAADPAENGLFVLCGHSYELEALGQWEQLASLLAYIQSFGFLNMTTMEFVERCYDKEGYLCL